MTLLAVSARLSLSQDAAQCEAEQEHAGREREGERLGQPAREREHQDHQQIEQHAEHGHGRGALRVQDGAAPKQGDCGPVDAEQRFEAAEGEQRVLIRVGEQRSGEAERRAAEDELQPRARREVLGEDMGCLGARHLRNHEDGEDEPVPHVGRAVALARAPLERWGPQEHEHVQRRLIERVHQTQRNERPRAANGAV